MMEVRQIFKSMAVSWALAILLVTASAPATAHKKDKKKQAETSQIVQTGQAGQPAAAGASPETVNGRVAGKMDGMNMDMGMDRSRMTFLERFVAWFGRMHPAVVHFPIAFFPAAWFTAIVGRRRPAFSAPVQFLVVAGGIFAPIAAVAGWLTAADADPSAILTYHRWIGTGVGVGGLLLGIWAWRRPWEDRGAGMIAALTVMTVAVVVQAGLGAMITHGMEHMMF